MWGSPGSLNYTDTGDLSTTASCKCRKLAAAVTSDQHGNFKQSRPAGGFSNVLPNLHYLPIIFPSSSSDTPTAHTP